MCGATDIHRQGELGCFSVSAASCNSVQCLCVFICWGYSLNGGTENVGLLAVLFASVRLSGTHFCWHCSFKNTPDLIEIFYVGHVRSTAFSSRLIHSMGTAFHQKQKNKNIFGTSCITCPSCLPLQPQTISLLRPSPSFICFIHSIANCSSCLFLWIFLLGISSLA